MTTTISSVSNETAGNDVIDHAVEEPEKRPSRLEERRAIRAASPARAAVGELAASGALDGLFGKIDDLAIPRDREGTFTPQLVPKGSRRVGGLDDIIISLYAGGMTVRDIADHLEATIGTEVSPATISNITDAVSEEILAWQSRPLDGWRFLDVVAN